MILDALNINLLYLSLGAIAAILGLFLAIFGISSWFTSGKRVSSRLDDFIAPEAQPVSNSPTRQIVLREISGSLFSRTINSWFKNFLNYLGRFTPQKMLVELDHKLTIAGNPANMRAGDFYAIKSLVFLAGIIAAILINRDFGNINLNSLMTGMGIIVVCYFFPDFWLKKKMRTRQDEIRRGLPDALDMLSVCASAGLGFDQSLQKVSSYWETELGFELKRVTQEMEMGFSRSVALRNLSNRLDVDDLSRFVAIIIQAEKVGMSYADVLHSQALQLRVQRQYRAREIANKLPGKMILPIAVLIFPAMLAVIMGPAIPTLLDLF